MRAAYIRVLRKDKAIDITSWWLHLVMFLHVSSNYVQWVYLSKRSK